ncbi:hypothetical protein A2630_02200 [Candidatus Woesebacteria bacterium RIFCSPHIGHO2_01_FULL_44_10]|uniref:CBS domain-containing protein n=1 Tax=Candidatus Woesebacteria bacterium RIFCSPLOWO2_01_FULL_44_14 TaxID=1802525 RepID=A0A1F8C0Q6_9BACT|nr:MAG: hypothetical protein A2630_02200 [Candidatus Woesebacteria bacterium RIFCSPHIGHO2_01_FULL_44_10]OGM53965.1 MAG: hypothetical protein A3F62_00140 [Candidatus Woesebacteria bacterium RIFCSPHIGHO2_12_FULL_44_11]OGM69933.1 MAG: hypothetical protein A2975_04975 [Candidatus Woesebacteria bacterium RIFCSPLOWO2_01_FULL_44_14]
MNKLVPFSEISKLSKRLSFLGSASVVVDEENVPIGYVMGRDLFVSLLELIDEEFEKKVADPQKAFDNPAGRLIDIIERNLPLRPEVIAEIEEAKKTKREDWIPFEEVVASLNV